MQRDAEEYTAGINLYSYCSNNPVNWVDPMGWDKEKPESPRPVVSVPEVTPKPPTPELEKPKENIPWWKNLWRHLYIDVGYTGLAPGKLGGVMNIGFKIAPSGFYYYQGVGIGVGKAGVSATVNMGSPPSAGLSVGFVGRGGTGIWGVKGGGGFGENKGTGNLGVGWGIGAGSGIVGTQTIQIIEW